MEELKCVHLMSLNEKMRFESDSEGNNEKLVLN